MGKVFLSMALTCFGVCFFLKFTSCKNLRQEVHKLKGAQTLIFSDIKLIKEKLWVEVAAEIEMLKQMLEVKLQANQTSNENLAEAGTLPQEDVNSEELLKKLKEETGHRTILEEKVKGQAKTIVVLTKALQDQKLHVKELSNTCNQLQVKATSDTAELKQKIASNKEENSRNLERVTKLEMSVEKVMDTQMKLGDEMQDKADTKQVNETFNQLKSELTIDFGELEQQSTLNSSENWHAVRKFERSMNKISREQAEMKAKLQNCTENVISLSQKLKSFKKPGFISDWILMKSQDASLSEVTIAHGLGVLPYKVEVQVQPTEGSNADWIFPAAPAVQSDDDYGHFYGGVVYLYNDSHVILRAPNRNNNINSGRIIYTGQNRSMYLGKHHQTAGEALVRVKVWGPDNIDPPDSISEWKPLDIFESKYAFYDIPHGLEDYPALVTVQVRCGNAKEYEISEGVGASIKVYNRASDYGGVVWASGKQSVRIWSYFDEDKTIPYQYLCGGTDGWGSSQGQYNKNGHVRILVWSRNLFQPNLNFFGEESATDQILSFEQQISTGHDYLSFYVLANDGANQGYRFFSYGNSQAIGKPYGGAIYAYHQSGQLRVWRPNPDTSGYMVHIHEPYGGGVNCQASNNVTFGAVLIKAWV